MSCAGYCYSECSNDKYCIAECFYAKLRHTKSSFVILSVSCCYSERYVECRSTESFNAEYRNTDY